MNIMLACPGCTLNAMFGLRYLSPVYEQLRWVILLGALFAFLLPSAARNGRRKRTSERIA